MGTILISLSVFVHLCHVSCAQNQASLSTAAPTSHVQQSSTTPTPSLNTSSNASSSSINDNLLLYLVAALLLTFFVLLVCICTAYCTHRRKHSNKDEENTSPSLASNNIGSLIDNYVTSQRISMHHHRSQSSDSDSSETRQQRASIMQQSFDPQRPSRSQVNVTVISTDSNGDNFEFPRSHGQSLQPSAALHKSSMHDYRAEALHKSSMHDYRSEVGSFAQPMRPSLGGVDSNGYVQQGPSSLASTALNAPVAGSYRLDVGSFAMPSAYMFGNGRKSTIKLTHVEHEEDEEVEEHVDDHELATEMVTMCDIEDAAVNDTQKDTTVKNAENGAGEFEEQDDLDLMTDHEQMTTIVDEEFVLEQSTSSETEEARNAMQRSMMHVAAGLSDHESEEAAEEMYDDRLIEEQETTKETPATGDTEQ